MRYKGFEGMDEFLAALDSCEKNAPELIEKEIAYEGRSITRAYRKKIAPHRITGNLAKGMTFNKGDIKKDGNSYVGYVKNDDRRAPHYHLVEYGHDIVVGGRKAPEILEGVKGRSKSYGDVVGHVKGKLYFAKTISEESRRIQKRREHLLEKILHDLE